MAEAILRGVQKQAETAGVTLDVGEFPEGGNSTVEPDDPERLLKITAHAVARVADRFTFLRKLSRHMEGSEKRAGILADVAAAVVTLYKRNPQQIEVLARHFLSDLQTRRTAAKAASEGQQNGGPVPMGPQPVQPQPQEAPYAS